MNAQENKRYPLLLSFWVWKATMTQEVPQTSNEVFKQFARLSDVLLFGGEFFEWMERFRQEIGDVEQAWHDFLDHVKELFELVRSGNREDLRASLEADKEVENPDEYDDDDIIEYFEDYTAFLAGEALYLEEDEDDDDYLYEDEGYGSNDGIQYDEYEESGVDHPFF